MKIIRKIKDLSSLISNVGNLGFVPTMGGIHSGHLSLINKSMKKCNKTLVSIYVNPTQFNNKSDFKSYPRNFKRDINILKNKKIPVYGKGNQIREWIYVVDHIQGIEKILKKGEYGESYNLGSTIRMKNLDLVNTICNTMDEIFKNNSKLYLGNEFTEDKIKSIDFSKYKFISFATHAVIANQIENIGEPGLILTPPVKANKDNDGILTV